MEMIGQKRIGIVTCTHPYMPRNKSRKKKKKKKYIEKTTNKVIKTTKKYLLIFIGNKKPARKIVGYTDDQDMEGKLRDNKAVPEVVENYDATVFTAEEVRDIHIENHSLWEIHPKLK